MIKKVFTYLLFIFLLACNKENAPDCLKSNGTQTTETRLLAPFSEIILNDKMELSIAYGTSYKIEINGGQNVLPKITTEVNNGVLTIENKNRCNFVRGYKKNITLNVTLPVVRNITNNSVANIYLLPGFIQDSIYVSTDNSGDISVNGNFQFMKINTAANGDVYLYGYTKVLQAFMNNVTYLYGQELLVSDSVFVQTNSIANCYFQLQNVKVFQYNIQNSGNIYYSGDPLSISNLGDDLSDGSLIKQD